MKKGLRCSESSIPEVTTGKVPLIGRDHSRQHHSQYVKEIDYATLTWRRLKQALRHGASRLPEIEAQLLAGAE